jgi:hypothetical protein
MFVFAKGLVWSLLARGVARRFGWLPVLLMAGRVFRRRRPRARRVDARQR